VVRGRDGKPLRQFVEGISLAQRRQQAERRKAGRRGLHESSRLIC
jgi:hypothetical protein